MLRRTLNPRQDRGATAFITGLWKQIAYTSYELDVIFRGGRWADNFAFAWYTSKRCVSAINYNFHYPLLWFFSIGVPRASFSAACFPYYCSTSIGPFTTSSISWNGNDRLKLSILRIRRMLSLAGCSAPKCCCQKDQSIRSIPYHIPMCCHSNESV